MLIIPLNLDSVLLLLYNSKLAYWKSEICLLFGRWRSGYQNKFLWEVRPRAELRSSCCVFLQKKNFIVVKLKFSFIASSSTRKGT